MNKGKFITFEGGEGTGKTTQIKILKEKLEGLGKKVILTKEPGGTVIADKMRNILVTGKAEDLDSVTEFMLLSAGRHNHIRTKIIPALQQGVWVISDRFADSSRVYQGYAGGIAIKTIEYVYNVIASNFKPHLTIVMDIDPVIGLKRSLREDNLETRFETKDISFHKKVREGYLELVKTKPKRCHLIDADDTIDNLSIKIYNVVKDKFNL